MFGNKFAAEELARNFHQRMSKLQTMKKKASAKKKASTSNAASKTAQVKPEDFLVAPAEEIDIHGDNLNSKIEEVSSYAEDASCDECGKEHVDEDVCGDIESSEEPVMVVMPMMEDDMSYLVDTKAQYIIHELGKIAGEMKSQDKNFASDMILSTANNIKNNALKKAAKKLKVVCGLRKMANDAYNSGDRMTGDVVSATINKIVKKVANTADYPDEFNESEYPEGFTEELYKNDISSFQAPEGRDDRYPPGKLYMPITEKKPEKKYNIKGVAELIEIMEPVQSSILKVREELKNLNQHGFVKQENMLEAVNRMNESMFLEFMNVIDPEKYKSQQDIDAGYRYSNFGAR